MSTTLDHQNDQMAVSGAPTASAGRQPVDRQRRFNFVAGVVGFCLTTAAIFSALAGFGMFAVSLGIVELFIGGMLSLATATTLGYLTGSVVDYNGGVGSMFSRAPARPLDYDPHYDPHYDPQARG